MREILFRGKRISSGEWVIGGIMKTFHPNYDCKNEEDFLSQKPNCYCICANNKDYFVEQASIGQYTGLTDKNGKKIFEGDLLDCEDRICVVSWHEKCGTWDCNFVRYKGKICSNGITPVEWKYRAEVIGNIHDNPELMKGGEE